MALAMTCILGVVALATDVGVLLNDRRKVQVAADYAALAGAQEIRYATSDGKTVAAVAQAAAAQSGFTNGSNGVTVTVNNSVSGPLTGPHAGNKNYVEVIVQRASPTYFMKLFGHNSINVSARAVAGLGVSNKYCAYILDPTGSGALQGQGASTATFNNCGVIVDSNSSSAVSITGGAGSITASSISIVGGSGSGSISPAPATGVAQISDPLGFLSLPDPNTLSCNAPPGGTLTGVIGTGGTVCYSGDVNLSNVTLSGGTFVFTGNVSLSGTVTSGTNGATLDIASGSLSENTNASLSITAPTTGAYSGIAIMQPLANTNQLTFAKGNSGGTIDGIIYAPGAQLYLHDNAGSLTVTSDIIVKTIYDKASTLTVTSYSQTHSSTSVLRFAGLAE